ISAIWPGTALRWAGLPVHRDVLAFGEGKQPFGATLAAQTALFHAPERRGRVGDEPSIEANHAGLDSLANAKATGEICRIDVGNKAVLGAVGELDRLVLGSKRHDRCNRSEYLGLQDRSIWRHV